MRGALDVHRELLARDVPHEVVRLSSRAGSADDLPRLLGVAAGCVAVRCYEVVRDGRPDAFAAVLVPAGRVPDPAALLEALGARAVRPASAALVNAVTAYAAGLVSPFCLPPHVELLADTALGASDVSWCALGEGGTALGIRTRDLLVATGTRVATLPAPVRASPTRTRASCTWTAPRAHGRARAAPADVDWPGRPPSRLRRPPAGAVGHRRAAAVRCGGSTRPARAVWCWTGWARAPRAR